MMDKRAAELRDRLIEVRRELAALNRELRQLEEPKKKIRRKPQGGDRWDNCPLVERYVRERLEFGHLYEVRTAVLYEDYLAWCYANDITKPEVLTTLSRKLRAVSGERITRHYCKTGGYLRGMRIVRSQSA
jgi:hypothetical protein